MAQDWKETLTKTYGSTKDENKVHKTMRAKYAQNKCIMRFAEAIQISLLGQMNRGYLLSLEMEWEQGNLESNR
jgi:hypothetical protein